MVYIGPNKRAIQINIFFLCICCGYCLEVSSIAPLISAHNICFFGEIRYVISIFLVRKKKVLSRAIESALAAQSNATPNW